MGCLGEFAGAGELADACVFGIFDNLRFFAVAQRAYNAYGVFFVGYHRGHAAEFALVEHVHQQGLYNVVHVVAQRNLVVAVFAGELDEFGAPLGTAPIAVQLTAFFKSTFYRHVLKEERDLRVLRRHPLQEFPRGLVRKVALDVDGGDFAVGQKTAHTAGQFHQEHAGILAAANGNQHLVAVFNQVEVVQCLGNLFADAFADGVGHVGSGGKKWGPRLRNPVLICS